MKRLGLMAAAAALTASSAFAADGIEINKFLKLSGFLDMGYVNTSIDAGFHGLTAVSPIGAQDTATFAVQQAELDFDFNIADDLSARIDLSGGTEASGVQNLGVANIDELNMEQMRIDLNKKEWGLTFGKWDNYMALEGNEPTLRYQDTISLTNELLPTQQTGINVNYTGEMFLIDVGVVNGLMVENPDVNNEIGFQVHLGVKPGHAWSLNASYGTAEEATGQAAVGLRSTEVATGVKADTSVLDLNAQYQDHNWTIGAEYVNMNIDGATAAADLENTAWMLMVNYQFSEAFSLTGRYSVNEGKTGGDLSEISIAPIYNVTKNWLVMAEYRADSGSRDYNGTANGVGGTYATGDTDASALALKTILRF